jgi:hypothetical protein
MTNLYIACGLLGFGLGFNVANIVYMALMAKMKRTWRAEVESIKVEHARLERDLFIMASEARGVPLPPELRQ